MFLLFENLKARFLKSIITWSEMGQQTVHAKEVHLRSFVDLIEGPSSWVLENTFYRVVLLVKILAKN